MIEQKDVIVVDITDKILEGAGDILEGVDYYPPSKWKALHRTREEDSKSRTVMSIGKAGMLDYIDGELQIGGMDDGDKYDIIRNNTKISVKTFTNHWQPVPINHTAIFPSHNLENLIGAEIYMVVCVCLDEQKLNIVGVITKERLKEIAVPCDKGEMIGVGKKYPAVAEGLWIQYNQLDPFVLEEWNDKVATA